MSRHRSRTLGTQTARASALGGLELIDLASRPADHFTRLWPTRPEQPGADAPLFLACMLPARLAALALLWVTAAPARMVVALAAACALAVLLLV
jgi:Flp pilus assembly protein TadB